MYLYQEAKFASVDVRLKKAGQCAVRRSAAFTNNKASKSLDSATEKVIELLIINLKLSDYNFQVEQINLQAVSPQPTSKDNIPAMVMYTWRDSVNH